MNICITLCYAVGRGVQNVYGDLKEKRSMKQEKKLLRRDRSESTESYDAEPSPTSPRHDSPGERRPRRDSQPEPVSPIATSESNRVLGISSDARAAAHAHRSLALVTGMQQARRNLFETQRYEVEAVPPPQYDVSAPRLPNYDTVVGEGIHDTHV